MLPRDRFAHIVLLGVLERLDDPVAALERLRPSLRAGACMHGVVNLAESLHRLLGVEMGLIESVYTLSAQDVALGHRRTYSQPLLVEHLESAGFESV